MLADISNVDAIYIVCGRTDMRKSIDGLCAIIQEQFSMVSARDFRRKNAGSWEVSPQQCALDSTGYRKK